MPAMQEQYRVEMVDGEVWETTVDQRDAAAFEATDLPQRTNIVKRYLAWSASKRQGKTGLPWAKFNDQCVEAELFGGGEVEELDPTQPDPSGGNS